MKTIKERLLYFLTTLPNKHGGVGMTKGAFQTKTGMKAGAIANMGRTLHKDTVDKIKSVYPELNELWLLHGQEPMLLHRDIKPSNIIHLNPMENKQSPQEDSSKNLGVKDSAIISQSALDEMLAINKTYADAQLNFSEAQKNFSFAHIELTQMLKEKTFTENELREIRRAESAKVQILQELLIEVGTGKSWKTAEEGKARIHNMFSEAAVKDAVNGTHDDVSKQSK